jgi:peptidoglycan hydrolase CwlO-like protein
MRVSGLLLSVVGLMFLAPTLAHAQRQFDPAQFKQQRLDRIKEQLGSTDDEWKVLQPKIEKVMDAQMAGFGGGFGRRGGNNADNTPQTPTAKAQAELRELLQNKDASADDIKAKLTALREARAKTKADLDAARKDLKEVLTQRQEAVLVTNGMLE